MSSPRWAAGLVLAAAIVVVVSARPALAADPLIGTWENQGADKLVVTFDAGGAGKMNETSIKWSLAGQKLTLVAEGDTHEYTIKLDGDTLVVSGGDLDAPMTLKRKGAAKKTGFGGQVKGGDRPDPAPQNAKKNTSIIGHWRGGDGSTIHFTKDTLKLGGNDIPAEIGPDEVVLTGRQGQKVKWPYKLDGDTLEITVGGQKQVWQRVVMKDVGPAPEKPRAKTLAGKWGATDGTIIQFNPDGTFIYGGQTVTYKAADGVITINNNEWKYKLDGDSLELTLPGEPPTVLKRIGGDEGGEQHAKDDGKKTDDAPKGDDPKIEPAKGGGNVVGAWDSKEGTLFLRADGTGHSAKDGDFKWSLETLEGKPCIKFVQGDKWLGLPYTQQGDKLVFGTGPTVVLTRAGVAGVWVGEEAVLDPGNYLSFTQYVVLYKDGSIGYAKSEGYASRQQVTENWERFYSGGERGAEKKSVGTWKQTGPGTLSLKLNGREEVQARYDLDKMILRIPGMGKLPGNEGGSLDFKRK
ncbi:MAG: hypothetical protein ACAI25_09400 [Planctomycetota bacterium]